MEIKKIYEALLNRNEKVCNKEEIVSIIKEYKKKFNSKLNTINTIKYFSRHGYIKKIFRGYYYINSMDERKRKYCKYIDKELLFLVLNKAGIRWYLGLGSALYESGKSWQVPVMINIINNKISGKKKILGLNIRFYKTKENLIIGLKKARTKNNIMYYYSIPSKTYLDMVYFRVSNKLVKDSDTKKYIRYFPKWLEKK